MNGYRELCQFGGNVMAESDKVDDIAEIDRIDVLSQVPYVLLLAKQSRADYPGLQRRVFLCNFDCYDAALGSLPHGLVVASSEDHSNAFLLVNEEKILLNARGADGTLNARIKADIVFFETPGGGAVLSTGSIAFVASLAHNDYRNNISRLIRNAVDRFLDPAPFLLPDPEAKQARLRGLVAQSITGLLRHVREEASPAPPPSSDARIWRHRGASDTAVLPGSPSAPPP